MVLQSSYQRSSARTEPSWERTGAYQRTNLGTVVPLHYGGIAQGTRHHPLPRIKVYDREYTGLIDRLNNYNRRMIVAGQMNCPIFLKRNIPNCYTSILPGLPSTQVTRPFPGIPVKNFDRRPLRPPEEKLEKMVPDLLITYGGHIVSKRLKQFLRKHPPREHWHVSLSGEVTDLYGSLTTVIEMDPFEFLEKIAYLLENRTTEFPRIWENNTRDRHNRNSAIRKWLLSEH